MMLTGREVSVAIGKTPILHAVDFEARAGHLTAIVGPNGSGKTTLLRALCGEVAYSGSVSINGVDVRDQKPWELAAIRGVLPQATALAFPFTAVEVVRIGLLGGTFAARDDLPSKALARVGLPGFEHRFYQELSGGEQQRVQLARVLVQVWQPLERGTPRWLILDEPVSSLDIAHQLSVMGLARQFARDGGGVVAVMHDLNLTALYADHVVLMQAGRTAAHGNVSQVLRDDILSAVYGCRLRVNAAPSEGETFILPHAAEEPVISGAS